MATESPMRGEPALVPDPKPKPNEPAGRGGDRADEQTGDLSNLALLRQFRRCAHLQHHASSSGGRNRILATLHERGPMTQRALAERIERTPATLSQQLEPLEAAGLVVREPLPEDRRTVTVRLTASGEQAALEVLASRQRTANELFGALDDCDRADLARVLGRLEERWRARREEGAR